MSFWQIKVYSFEKDWESQIVTGRKIKKRLRSRSLLWCHQESNRGHKDFQSFALPTELWHPSFLTKAGAKVLLFFELTKYFDDFFVKIDNY